MVSRRIQDLKQEIENLEKALNQKRKELLALEHETNHITKYSSAEKKIALFKSLFRGRDDMFALRFENKTTGKSGYQPACGNEWKPRICEKPKIQCSKCSNRLLLPLTNDVIKNHLEGVGTIAGSKKADFTVGVYPLLEDEKCHFLAVDFDKKDWKEDAREFLETCKELSVPAYIERSRSGNGSHLWIFFKESISAKQARDLGSLIITKTLDRRPEIGLDSFDRFFPNQDTMPKGGFGNLIALPLQNKPRKLGHSVFLNEKMEVIDDQWAFLAGIKKLEKDQVFELLMNKSQYGDILPISYLPIEDEEADSKPWEFRRSEQWPLILEGVPQKVEIILSNQVFIDSTELPPIIRNRILRIASFTNPEFFKAQSMRLPTWNKPRILYCYEQFPNHIGIPIGCLDRLLSLLKHYNIEPIIEDKRNQGKSIDITFRGELYPEQKKAVEKLLEKETGILSATTAFGKTVVALYMIATRKINTLILVHRKRLMDQWVERIQQFLDIPKKEIGKYSGTSKKILGKIDIAVIQSVYSGGEVKEWIRNYGQIIVDECHHISAYSFEQTIRHADAFFKLGLSATLTRKDGQHPIVQMNLGNVRYRVNARQEAQKRSFDHFIKVRDTGLKIVNESDFDGKIQELFKAVWQDEIRNQIIIDDVLEAYGNRRKIILLSERKEHLSYFFKKLETKVNNLYLLQGGLRKKAIDHIIIDLENSPPDEGLVLLATGKYLGEGFDLPKLDTLFLTFPISWKGTISQYAGRLHRDYYGKEKVIIYDYADLDVPILSRMFQRRVKGYAALGYELESF